MKILDKSFDGRCVALPFTFEIVTVRTCGGVEKDAERSRRLLRIATPGYSIVAATDTFARNLKKARTFLTVSGAAGTYQLVFNRLWADGDLHRIAEAENEEDVRDLLHWALPEPVVEYQL